MPQADATDIRPDELPAPPATWPPQTPPTASDAPRPVTAANLAYQAAQSALAAADAAYKVLSAEQMPGEFDHQRAAGLLSTATVYREIANTLGERQHTIAPQRSDDPERRRG